MTEISTKLTGLPSAFDIQVQTVNEQVTSLETYTQSLREENELLHDQIAAAQKKQRANDRKIARNEKEADKLRKKRDIASAAARAIMDVDAP